MLDECGGSSDLTNKNVRAPRHLNRRARRDVPVKVLAAMRKLAAIGLWALALVAESVQAGAEETPRRTSSLSWVRLEGAESCIATQTLAHDVEDALKRKVFVSAADADISVEGNVARTEAPAGWRATVRVRDAKGALLGVRELESADRTCEALGKQLTFVVSVMIDSEVPAPPPALQPPALRVPRPEVVVERETVYVPVEPKPPPRPWSFAAGVSSVVGLGLLPAAGLGVRATVLVDPPHFWAIAASGTYWLDQSVAAERGAKANVALAFAALGLCPIADARARISWRACAGAQVGSLRIRGVGFDNESSAERIVVNVALDGQFGMRLAGPLIATVGLGFLVPLAKSELSYRTAEGGERQIFRASPVAVTGDLGLALLFP